ncbi:MAG: aryl-sulfate sulfotransferase [Nakamurella sp.]
MLEAQIQRIRVSDGAVLQRWRSLKDFPLTDSCISPATDTVDYMHVNALSNDPDDSDAVAVSARNISQVFKLNIKTGVVEWKVGGKRPTLALSGGAVDTLKVGGKTLPFSFQHDVRVNDDGTFSVFDNGNQRPVPYSRSATFRVNTGAHTATEINDAELRHAPDLYGDIQGNAQLLNNGNRLVYFAGHESTGHATEFGPDGAVVQEITAAQSYRVLKYEWPAAPTTDPDLAVVPAKGGKETVSMSWNGATEVARWQLFAGAGEASLKEVSTIDHSGFETTAGVDLPDNAMVMQVKAVDSSGKVLGTSALTKAAS